MVTHHKKRLNDKKENIISCKVNDSRSQGFKVNSVLRQFLPNDSSAAGSKGRLPLLRFSKDNVFPKPSNSSVTPSEISSL